LKEKRSRVENGGIEPLGDTREKSESQRRGSRQSLNQVEVENRLEMGQRGKLIALNWKWDVYTKMGKERQPAARVQSK